MAMHTNATLTQNPSGNSAPFVIEKLPVGRPIYRMNFAIDKRFFAQEISKLLV